MTTDMSIATIMITTMSAPTTPPTTAPILPLLAVVGVVSDEEVAGEVRVEEEVSEVVSSGNCWCVCVVSRKFGYLLLHNQHVVVYTQDTIHSK